MPKKTAEPTVCTRDAFRTITQELAFATRRPIDEVIEHFRASIEGAAARVFAERKVEASLVDDAVALYLVVLVVDGPARDARQLALDDAREVDPDVALGDELMFQLHYLGDAERVAAQNALTRPGDPALVAMLARWRAEYPGVLAAARDAFG